MVQLIVRRGTRTRREIVDPAAERDIKQRMCSAFECWIDCSNAACRRAQECVGDSLACFDRYWDSRPDVHAWVVAASRARKSGLSVSKAMRAADKQAPAGAGAAADLPWIRDYLESFDKVAPSQKRTS